MKNAPYYLSKHAFFCLADNHYVFLDLRSDEYLCLGRTHTNAIKGLLDGQQVVDNHLTNSQLQETRNSNSSVVIQALLKKGIFVQDEAYGKVPARPSVDAPAASLIEAFDKTRSRIDTAHIWHFFAAAATASRELRWGCIERTVRRVEARKLYRATDAAAVDSSLLANQLDTFQTLRPYYPRPYLCLFDSLALLHFLARIGVFPQWVFGVKLEPFAAHCWVQAGEIVVNDIVDNVRDYTPIMSV